MTDYHDNEELRLIAAAVRPRSLSDSGINDASEADQQHNQAARFTFPQKFRGLNQVSGDGLSAAGNGVAQLN